MMPSPERPVSILLVDDDEEDFLLTQATLDGQSRMAVTTEWCSDYGAAIEVIQERRHDVYLVDYRLGARTGLELVREGFAFRPWAPVLMLTGQRDYEIDLEASALGVTDYLLKQELEPSSLERSIRYAINHHRALHDLARSEERYALAVRGASDGIWDWDLVAHRIYFSPRWQAILGREEQSEDEEPSVWFDAVHPEDLTRLQRAVDAHLAGETEYLEVEYRIRHADGTWRWALTRGLAIRDEAGVATRMAGSLFDSTERRAAERQLQHDALHDSLTGLPNRALLMDRLDHVIQRGGRDDGSGCAVLFMDIDRFKVVNDSLSHAVGDRLLVAFGRRVQSVLRPGDTVARLGGDEFTILLEGITSEPGARAAAERVLDALREPFDLDGRHVFAATSIGIALTTPGASAAELLRNADLAMYDAKRSGRACVRMFDESMHRRVVHRLSRENELREAVEKRLIEVHYQPITELSTGRIQGVEALARWPSDWPAVAPNEFIAIAEETGDIDALGMHVLEQALDTLARWRSSGLVDDEVRMSVNLSGRQLYDSVVAERIADSIHSAGLPGAALRLEITESTLMHDVEQVQPVIAAISAAGVELHLDDYGTGYSSLAALHRFPVEALKIDRSFIHSLVDETDGGGEAIVRSTIALAHTLGKQVIAEGIETGEQLERLQALGCDSGQGFLFSRPVAEDAMQSLLRRGTLV